MSPAQSPKSKSPSPKSKSASPSPKTKTTHLPTPISSRKNSSASASRKSSTASTSNKITKPSRRRTSQEDASHFIQSLGYHPLISHFSRRERLVDDRRTELYHNAYLTSKATVCGWYLDPASHEPFWAGREVKGPFETLRRFERKALRGIKGVYARVGEERRGRVHESVLSEAEMRFLRGVCGEKKGEVVGEKGVEKGELDAVLSDLRGYAADAATAK